MRKVKLITALSLAVLMLVSLSNTVSAEATMGPPIGGQTVVFNPHSPLPNQPVNVTINWWINETDGTCNVSYTGPFNLTIGNLKDSDGNKVADWARHNTTGIFGFEANETNPYTYNFTENAPSVIGTYNFSVQTVATGEVCQRPVGGGNTHPLLVASEGGTFTEVPEFSTIAIPVAAILGLLFFFNHRKRRKD